VDDSAGFSPLVLVADEDPDSRVICEAILAKLRFAVAPVDSVDKAVTVIATLRPDVIVAHARDTMPLQRAAWPSGVPFVAVTDNLREPEALVGRSARRSGTAPSRNNRRQLRSRRSRPVRRSPFAAHPRWARLALRRSFSLARRSIFNRRLAHVAP
jgi:hypothetical protein